MPILTLLHNQLNNFRHYIGVLLVIVGIYLFFGPMISRWEDIRQLEVQTSHIAVSAPTPVPGVGATVASVADAAKDTALSAAIQNQALQLSAAQQAIARMAEVLGANAKFASGFAGAVTSAAPKQQVVEVVLPTPTAKFSPTPEVSDTQFVKDIKKVLAETPLQVQNKAQVTVKWEDKPLSPFFATYSSDGSSGMGYTVRRAPWLNLDGLIVQKVDVGTKVGVGLSHTLKGTAGSIGLAGLVDPRTGKVTPEAYVGIHW